MAIEASKLKVRCPACNQWIRWGNNPFRPFCSEICKNKDLGNWATEKYRIPLEDQAVGEEREPGGKRSDESED